MEPLGGYVIPPCDSLILRQSGVNSSKTRAIVAICETLPQKRPNPCYAAFGLTRLHRRKRGLRSFAASKGLCVFSHGVKEQRRPSDGMVDMADSKSAAARRAGSSPASGTIFNEQSGCLPATGLRLAKRQTAPHRARRWRSCFHLVKARFTQSWRALNVSQL